MAGVSMSDDVIGMITELVEWLAMPMVYVLLGLIFFILIVKPFFLYVFDPDRVASHNAATKTTSINDASKELNELLESDDLTIEPDKNIPDILTDDQKIAKLAASSPAKGQALVKQWLNSDQKSGR
jgi:flagellar biosynthesis/type III secretory pathway M-ring protein FliF/YscJ